MTLKTGLMVLITLFLVFRIVPEASAERFFQTHNTWYEPVPTSVTLDAHSAEKIRDIRCYKSATPNYPISGPECTGAGSFYANYRDWSIPLWRATSGTANIRVMTDECAKDASHASCTTPTRTFQKEGWDIIQMPVGALPAGNASNVTAWPNKVRDGHMTVISADGKYEWDLQGVYFPADYSDARLRGKYVVKYLRRWDLTTDGVNFPEDGKGGTVFGKVPHSQFLITYNDIVNQSEINHAIGFGYFAAQQEAHWQIYPSGGYVNGLICTTETCASANPTLRYRSISTTQTMPLLGGERLFLPQSVDCDAIGAGMVETKVCKALKKYGMIYVINTSVGANTIAFEDLTDKPYSWSGIITDTYFTKIPWGKLQVSQPIYPSQGEDTQAPSTPTGLTAVAVSSNQVNLTWTASTDNVGVAGYKVYRGTTLIATVTATSYSNTGLTPSTTYNYSVKAFDAAGNVSAKSVAVSATTQASSDTQAPSVPSGLKATAVSFSQIDLSWTASSDNVGVAGYKVYRGTNLITTTTTKSYSDTGLSASTTYIYAVAAFDSAGNTSAQSTAVSATTMVIPPPNQTPLKLNSGNVEMMLRAGTTYVITWDAPSTAESFDLYLSINNGISWQSIVKGVSGSSFDWKVPTLDKNSTKCLLKIVGYDAAGNKVGTDISDARFTIQVARMRYPNGGQTFTAEESVNVTWSTYGTIRPVASVKLKYTTNGGRTWKFIDKVSGNPGSYNWQLPAVTEIKDKCRVAVILKDKDGKTIGTDGCDAYFTIQP